MSRSGYHETDYDDVESVLSYGRWRAQVKNSLGGKRGQAFLKSIIEALDAMPVKRLVNSPESKISEGSIHNRVYSSLGDSNGNVCVLGALANYRGMSVLVDAEDHNNLGNIFNITTQLAMEVMYMNDEYYDYVTPEGRWVKMRAWAVSQLKGNS